MCQWRLGRDSHHSIHDYRQPCFDWLRGRDCGTINARQAPIVDFSPSVRPLRFQARPQSIPHGRSVAWLQAPLPVVHQEVAPKSILKKSLMPPPITRIESEPRRVRRHSSPPPFKRAITEPQPPVAAPIPRSPGTPQRPVDPAPTRRDRSPSMDSRTSSRSRVTHVTINNYYGNSPQDSVPPSPRLYPFRGSRRPSAEHVELYRPSTRNNPRSSGDTHRAPSQASRTPSVVRSPPSSPRVTPAIPRDRAPLHLDTRTSTRPRAGSNTVKWSSISPDAGSNTSKRDSAVGVVDPLSPPSTRKASRHSSGNPSRPLLDMSGKDYRDKSNELAIDDNEDGPSAVSPLNKPSSSSKYQSPMVETAPPSTVAGSTRRPSSKGPVLWLDEERKSKSRRGSNVGGTSSVSRSRAEDAMNKQTTAAMAYQGRDGSVSRTASGGDERAGEVRRTSSSWGGSRSRAKE